jgi:signal transduction histidine kinase
MPDTASAIGDPSRIRQILRNVISNAFRYGGAEVAIRTSETENTTTISVSDSGTALARDEWESVFDPYYRSHSQPGQPDSVGLGLTVSRRLARAMGGDLIYQGVDGTSEFILLLPMARAPRSGEQRKVDESWLQPA